MKNKTVVAILGINKEALCVWMAFKLTRKATEDDVTNVVNLLEMYGIQVAKDSFRIIPLAHSRDRITFSVPYPESTFALPEKYEIFKAARRVIEQLITNTPLEGFQQKRLFVADVYITQIYQRTHKEAAHVA